MNTWSLATHSTATRSLASYGRRNTASGATVAAQGA
jgi:hypothetical protein